MSRRRLATQTYRVDNDLESLFTQMFTCRLMKNGKKQLAHRILFNTLKDIQLKTQQEPMQVLEQAVRNATPSVMVKSHRVGGAIYSVPVELSARRATALAIGWILTACRSRSGQSMETKLVSEILDASKKIGQAVRKKEETHRMAESTNRLVRN
uniref:Small ribosomal subunit protein uS7c n=1 Tax=Pseudobryopsis hainanensis TaxID=2320808 RepID=A0A3S7SXD1_9CHLO|nr:ribosomal protein S7 [Pseudobryopsis hainanensis]